MTADTLIALRAVDRRNDKTPRWMTEEVYDKAFGAWLIAQQDAYEKWSKLTDPSA